MITYNLTPYGYKAMINFIEYLWGKKEIGVNPSIYIENDTKWQIAYTIMHGDLI